MRPGADCSACRSATSSTRCKLKLKPCFVTLRTEEAYSLFVSSCMMVIMTRGGVAKGSAQGKSRLMVFIGNSTLDGSPAAAAGMTSQSGPIERTSATPCLSRQLRPCDRAGGKSLPAGEPACCCSGCCCCWSTSCCREVAAASEADHASARASGCIVARGCGGAEASPKRVRRRQL